MLEQPCLFQIWAKKKLGENSQEERYPLFFHMLDTSAVVHQLWDKSLQAGTRHFLAQHLGLSVNEARSWVSFWAGLHDIGKASPVFQSISQECAKILEAQGLKFEPPFLPCPHGQITTYVFPELMAQALLDTGVPYNLSSAVGFAVGGHHGMFCPSKPGPFERGDARWSEIRCLLAGEIAKLIAVPVSSQPKYTEDKAFYIALAGLTAVADWIASNETFFPYKANYSPEEHINIAQGYAERAVRQLAWAEWPSPKGTANFHALFPHINEPRPLQQAIINTMETEWKVPALVIIEAPMGEGKTEAAIYLADRWVSALGQKGTYFALPTQATSNQMFTRIKDFLEHRYPGIATNLRLLHGGALLSDDFADIQIRLSSEMDRADDSENAAAVTWFLPKKRGLLAPFGVGTIDQSLLAVLQTKHYFVRLFGLAQKTVIFDEVHAYDTYMSTLLERLIGWLGALGCSIIVLSATLPRAKREALLRAYGTDSSQTLASNYPRITWASSKQVQVRQFNASRKMNLQIRRLSDDLSRLVEELRNQVGEEGCVAIICNTVHRAQETYSALKHAGFLSDSELMLLHARYPFEERQSREEKVLASFGKKNGQRPKRAVLVSTQIIEQSLDVDFDLMITDLAPVDLVIQRAGRVHRHENRRPSPMAEPTLWIRMPDIDENVVPQFGSSEFVYERYVLLLSYLTLTDQTSIALPDDIEGMIEEVYGEVERQWPSAEFKEAVLEAKTQMKNNMQKQEFKARSNLIPDYASGDAMDFFYDFNKGLDEDNPAVHRSLQANTRDVEPSVQVVCLHKSGGGIFLRSGGEGQIDIARTPDGETIRLLLQRAMTITDKRVVFSLFEQQPPEPWKKCAPLRYHRLLEFENGLTRIGNYLLNLDPETGLSIEKNG